jgi:formylglycine-generating enzyme
MLLAATGCEVLAGLHGDRQLQPLTGEASAGGVTGGAPVGGAGSGALSGAGASGSLAGRDGQSLDAGSGGLGAGMQSGVAGEAGEAGDTGAAGSAGEPSQENPGVVLTRSSCAGSVPSGCGNVNPCLTLPLAGGTHGMGRDETGQRGDYFPNGAANEKPEHSVSVSPFWLDKYEVTVGRFRRFVDAYQGVPPKEDAGANPYVPGSGWRSEWNSKLPPDVAELRGQLGMSAPTELIDMDTWTEAPGAGECRPMNDLNWYLAFAFCIWDGGRLPSEAEWEWAAAGGDAERLFPWGSADPATRAVFNCSFLGTLSCTSGDLPNVGSLSPRGDGRFGHADLAGSLDEFTRDVYEVKFYSSSLATGADPLDLVIDVVADESAVRGGTFISQGDAIRATMRRDWGRNRADVYAGIRCARNL